MFNRISEGINQFYHEETLAERSKRMLPGAVYSAVAVSIYVIVSSIINVIFFKDLHLAVDWMGLLIRLVELGIGAALAGAIVGWFTESHEGIVWGGVVLALLILIGNLAASQISGRGTSLLGQSLIITIIPLIGAGALLAGAIRMAINRHTRISSQDNPGMHRKQFIQLTLVVLVVGLIPGVFALYSGTSINTIRSLNNTLENTATDPMLEMRFPYEKVPGLKDHFGMDYSLYTRISSMMTRSMDITIHFDDGYQVTCLVPQMASNEQLILDACNEGTNIRFP